VTETPAAADTSALDLRDRLLRVVVTIATAASLAAISAPANLHLLHWIAYVPFLWVLRAETPRANRAYSFLFGTVAVAVIFRWIVDTITLFSNIPAAGAWVLLILFSVAFGLPYFAFFSVVHPLRKRVGDLWMLVWPAWAVVVEFLAMHLTLFPYNQGIGQFGNTWTFQLASITGVWGLTFLVLWVNATLAETEYRRREGRPAPVRWIGAAVGVALAVTGWGAWRYQGIEAELAKAPVLRVGQIQLDTTMTHRLSTARQKTFFEWLHETEKLAPGSVDLVVWSEGASPFNVHEGQVKDVLSKLTRQGGFELFVGGGTVTRLTKPDGSRGIEAYNSVYLFGRDGEIKGRYDKTIPLPFGEYLPLADTFPFLADWIKGPGDFRAGKQTNVLEGELRYAGPICYEAILPSVCRTFPSPDVMVNVTNDAWFGDTAAPYQHAMLATARATELGIPLVRAGYTGMSMLVEPHGRVVSPTVPFTRVSRVVQLRTGTFPTIYARFGDWFVGLCGLLVLGAAAAARAKR
jgi:apolipoprotein N-acyltransferase